MGNPHVILYSLYNLLQGHHKLYLYRTLVLSKVLEKNFMTAFSLIPETNHIKIQTKQIRIPFGVYLPPLSPPHVPYLRLLTLLRAQNPCSQAPFPSLLRYWHSFSGPVVCVLVKHCIVVVRRNLLVTPRM